MEKRRRTVRQPVGALIALAAFAGTAQACELPPGTRVESPRATLSYRTNPPKIAVGEQFVLDFVACPKTGAALSGRVKLDAHMPGRWEFIFDLGGERLTHSVRIE